MIGATRPNSYFLTTYLSVVSRINRFVTTFNPLSLPVSTYNIFWFQLYSYIHLPSIFNCLSLDLTPF